MEVRSLKHVGVGLPIWNHLLGSPSNQCPSHFLVLLWLKHPCAYRSHLLGEKMQWFHAERHVLLLTVAPACHFQEVWLLSCPVLRLLIVSLVVKWQSQKRSPRWLAVLCVAFSAFLISQLHIKSNWLLLSCCWNTKEWKRHIKARTK